MLVLKIKKGTSLTITGPARIIALGRDVRVGVEADKSVKVVREDAKEKERKAA